MRRSAYRLSSAARASFELSAAQLRGAATHRVTGFDGRVPSTWYRELMAWFALPALVLLLLDRLLAATWLRPVGW